VHPWQLLKVRSPGQSGESQRSFALPCTSRLLEQAPAQYAALTIRSEAQPFGQADALRAAPSARGLPQTLGIAVSVLALLRSWLRNRRRGSLSVCHHEHEYRQYLKGLWEQAKEVSAVPEVSEGNERQSLDTGVRLSHKRPSPLAWKIAFTAAFSKAIVAADRSMQGRVLLALAELACDPATPRGDTVKPLAGAKQGLWRYRLGDFRLVYEPQSADQMVVLLDFAARGGVYE
jgi:mRNA interferase RelE/StbE